MTDRNRQPRGIAIGGQFATEPRTETDVALAAPQPPADMPIVIDDPDDPFGVPMYEGRADGAANVLRPGVYPASDILGNRWTVTVEPPPGPATRTVTVRADQARPGDIAIDHHGVPMGTVASVEPHPSRPGSVMWRYTDGSTTYGVGLTRRALVDIQRPVADPEKVRWTGRTTQGQCHVLVGDVNGVGFTARCGLKENPEDPMSLRVCLSDGTELGSMYRLPSPSTRWRVVPARADVEPLTVEDREHAVAALLDT